MVALNGHRKLIITIVVATLCLTILVAVVGKAFTGGSFSEFGREALIAVIAALVGFVTSAVNVKKE